MNLFGINGGELLVLIVLALLLLGPEKIPEYTRMLRDGVKKLRQMGEVAKTQFKEETGTDFDEVDWAKYDPRQYDPRRIIREALSEPLDDLQKSITDDGTTPSTSGAESSRKPRPRPAAGIPAVPEASAAAVAAVGTQMGDKAEEVAEQQAATEPEAPLPTPFDSEAT